MWQCDKKIWSETTEIVIVEHKENEFSQDLLFKFNLVFYILQYWSLAQKS